MAQNTVTIEVVADTTEFEASVERCAEALARLNRDAARPSGTVVNITTANPVDSAALASEISWKLRTGPCGS